MSAAPVLIFDSGVGGLSVVKPLRTLLPQAELAYVADTEYYPYGTRSSAEIEARVPAMLGRLSEVLKPRLIVIACNTASTIALEPVRAALATPIVGTVPAIKVAARVSKSRAIGVLGTDATIRQPYVDRLAADFAPDCRIVRLGSAELVDIAEAKLRGVPPNREALAAILAAMTALPGGSKIDTIVLACTHFVLLRDELEAASGRAFTFVDGSEGIARRARFLLGGQTWSPEREGGTAWFTGPTTDLDGYRPGFAAHGFAELKHFPGR